MGKINRFLSRLFLNDIFILIIVILNCIVIFLQCYGDQFRYLSYWDNFFTILFMIEATIKISSSGFREYWKDRWNRCDYIITIVSALSLGQFFYNNTFTEAIGFITVLRSLRALKLIRILKFIPNLSSFVKSIQLAVKTTSIIMLAFFILIFIVSIITCTLFRNVAPEYFANPLDSLYNTFRIFTVEGWYEIPDTIVAGSAGMVGKLLVRLYFSAILFFGGIIGMGLITSLLVDAMASDNNDEVLKKMKSLEEKLDELSRKLDGKKE